MSHPNAVEHNGVLYVVGLRDGQYWIRRSADGGVTWLPFSDEGLERPVAEAACGQRAALVKLRSQGERLLVCVPDWPRLLVYSSRDDGENWELDSEI